MIYYELTEEVQRPPLASWPPGFYKRKKHNAYDFLAISANRIWDDTGSEVVFQKHPVYGTAIRDMPQVVDLAEFMFIKLAAKDI